MPHDYRRSGRPAGLRFGQHARTFDRIQREVSAGFLLQLKPVTPGREFVGPGLDGVDITSRHLRDERAAPAVIDVQGHRDTMPFPIGLQPPDQRAGDLVMAVAVDIRPHFDAFADHALHGEAAAVDQRVNVFNMESAAGCSALDSLSGFVHGDATDLETAQLPCGQRSSFDLYRKPFNGHWFPGNVAESGELNTAILFPPLANFVMSRRPLPCKQRAE